jgi:predicted transcriptional regulator
MAEMRAETRYARQLFLRGDGSGAPIRNVVKLSEVSGVHEQTIRKHLPVWEKEAEEIITSSSEVGLAIHLSERKLAEAKSDEAFVRSQLDKLKFEIDSMEKIAVRLADWMDKFDGEDIPVALQIFSAWQQASGSESSLRSQFIAMKKLWDDKVGIDALRDVAVIRQKEIAKGQAKLQIKRMENETAVTTRNVVAGGVFKRPEQAGKGEALEVGEHDEG